MMVTMMDFTTILAIWQELNKYWLGCSICF